VIPRDEADDGREAGYVYNADSQMFHLATCSAAAKIAPANRRTLASLDEADAMRLRACGLCKPRPKPVAEASDRP
jgi:hypothetical protein